MSKTTRFLDALAEVSVQTKMKIILFLGLVMFPLVVLVLNDSLERRGLNNFIAVWTAGSLLLFLPLTRGALHLLVLRSVHYLNGLCEQMKAGNLRPFATLPPEPKEGDELQRLRHNMFWMGHVIHSRQHELAVTMEHLKETQNQLVSSIEYASLIQRSFLPARSELAHLFGDHFLLWSQRDTVGGDSYWYKQTPQGFFAAVIDCTGHGVPGAFMTLIVHSLFERLDMSTVDGDPAALVGAMNNSIKNALEQHDRKAASDEGMDCSVCFVPAKRGVVRFAGAGSSLFVTRADGTVQEVRGDRCGAGYVRTARDAVFTNHDIPLESGMRWYMASDGFADQIGGEKNLPFGKKRFMALLSRTAVLDCAAQQRALEEAFAGYRGHQPRRDDVTVLGFTVQSA